MGGTATVRQHAGASRRPPAVRGRTAARRVPATAGDPARTEPQALLLERYEVGEQIAAGGTARLFRARDLHLDRDVAVKVLHPHLLPDAVSVQRLEREARAAAILRHPGIATVYDVASSGRSPAIVMELVDGDSLAALLRRRGPMPPPMAADLVAQVADALYHAHRHGIVHRDVKPANVLVERVTGRARLIDFGIAHTVEAGSGHLTQTGMTLGTPRYMSPEQLAGERVGPRSDLWGLGCLLYEALVGRPSFDGTTPLAIARQQTAGPMRLDEIEPRLASIIRACLAPRIDDRPVHARAVAAALRAWRAGDPAAAAILWAGRRPAPLRQRVARWLDAADPRRWRPSRRRAAAAGVLAMMLTIGMAAGAALRPEPADASQPGVEAPVNGADQLSGGEVEHSADAILPDGPPTGGDGAGANDGRGGAKGKGGGHGHGGQGKGNGDHH